MLSYSSFLAPDSLDRLPPVRAAQFRRNCRSWESAESELVLGSFHGL